MNRFFHIIRLRIFFLLTLSFFVLKEETLFAQKSITKESRKEIIKLPSTGSYKVIKIKDGDTFVILVNQTPLTVRFAHVDCPEKKQDFGNRAKEFVSQRAFGKNIHLLHNNQYDSHGRLIAEIILEDGTNLNKELVRNGLAWHFKKYSTSKVYAALEMQARKQKIGVWSMPNPIAPWEWRRMK
ncbi:MAG TPA: thermonuclease family protein [Chitinophagaceae bacterium]|nr:MAG: nuclease [Bacteroidetes bacterium OLB11]HMN33046.1 thermonuclease family protein [Chitinophagaceae bacterium]